MEFPLFQPNVRSNRPLEVRLTKGVRCHVVTGENMRLPTIPFEVETCVLGSSVDAGFRRHHAYERQFLSSFRRKPESRIPDKTKRLILNET